MGTRSRIGIHNEDGTVTSIYCHWDGYVTHNGRILMEHYTTEERVRELMALGNLSSLGPAIGVKHPFRNPNGYGTPAYDEWEKQHHGMCTAYVRDRGETNAVAKTVPSGQFEGLFEEYNYLFIHGRWLVRCTYATEDRWVQVGEQLEKERAEERASKAA